MGIHTSTIKILEDVKRCDAIVAALLLDYNKEHIKRRFGITRQQLDHIVNFYNQDEMKNENKRFRASEPDVEQE